MGTEREGKEEVEVLGVCTTTTVGEGKEHQQHRRPQDREIETIGIQSQRSQVASWELAPTEQRTP